MSVKLKNQHFARIKDRTDLERELADRLLWLRNHYDVGKPHLKERVLRDVDETLQHFYKGTDWDMKK